MAIAYANRAVARLAGGDEVEAERDFKRSVELNTHLKPMLEHCFKQVRQQRLAASKK
jgi:hypothetical protein